MSDKIKVKGMGLLNAISFTNTLLQAGEYSILKSIEEQGMKAEFEKLFLSYIKDALFKLKTNAEEAVAEKISNPKYAAAVLKILSAKLTNSAVKDESFPDLQDKEYASNTIKLISRNETEISSKLSEADGKDVQDAVSRYETWSDLNNYVESHPAFQSYLESRLKSSSSKGCIVPIIMFLLIFFILGIFLVGMMGPRSSDFSSIYVIAYISFTSAGLLIGSIVYWAIANGRTKKEKEKVEEFERFFDENKLLAIDTTYNSSLDNVATKMKVTEKEIVNLIGKMPSFD